MDSKMLVLGPVTLTFNHQIYTFRHRGYGSVYDIHWEGRGFCFDSLVIAFKWFIMQIHAESIFSKQVSHAKKQKKGFYKESKFG